MLAQKVVSPIFSAAVSARAPEKFPLITMLKQEPKPASHETNEAHLACTVGEEIGTRDAGMRRNAHDPSSRRIASALKLEGKAESTGTLLFAFDLTFAGVFRIQNVPKEHLSPLIMIECPRLLFPFAREIVATSVRNGGFPPLLLDPFDFAALYIRRQQELAAKAAPYLDQLKAGTIAQVPDDATLAQHCRAESRAIVTLDLDFADIRHFPPRILEISRHRVHERRRAIIQ